MFKKTLVAAAAVATLATASVATAPVASAKTNIDVDIQFGGGYGPGYGGGYGWYEPDYGYGGWGISCYKGKQIVKWHGFHKVKAVKCHGKVMKFVGKKGWHTFIVRVHKNGTYLGAHVI